MTHEPEFAGFLERQDESRSVTRPPDARKRSRVLTPRQWLSEFASTSPSRFGIIVFTLLILIFTALLSLPIATQTGEIPTLANSLFTAVSAVCVTGLSVVDMSTYWTTFGDVVILLGMQVGGIGVLTFASMLGLIVSRRLGLRQRLLAASDTNPLRMSRGASESQAIGLGDIKGLLRAVALSVLIIELSLTVLIVPSLLSRGYDFGAALWNGFYLATSAFTNTGFVPMPEGLDPFSLDVYMLSVLAVGVFLGSIGFPVIFALYQYARKRGWRSRMKLPLHSKLTLNTTFILLVLGAIVIAALEWANPLTIGDQTPFQRIVTATYTSVMTRSGGLGTVDFSEMNGASLLFIDMLMFVGGGSASTAGGIKVTTLAVLFLAAYAEARGFQDMQAFGRRIPTDVLRVSVSVVLWGASIVAASSMLILLISNARLDFVLFDVISAFATTGLSTGLTAELPDAGKYVMAATMWAGRVGTVTLAAALAAISRPRLFRYPEERPIVG